MRCREHDPAEELPPCPRHATPEEWEAWYAALTPEQQRRRGCTTEEDEEAARIRAKRQQRRPMHWERDPFSYAEAPGKGAFPRVDQIAAERLSNTYRGDPEAGYCPHGFPLRSVRVSHAALVEEQIPRRVQEDIRGRYAWLQERIATDEAELRQALGLVLRERHRGRERRRRGTRYPIAWNALAYLRSRICALRDLKKEALREMRKPSRGQLCLFG